MIICDYCGEDGHSWEIHEDALMDVRAWQRENDGLRNQ